MNPQRTGSFEHPFLTTEDLMREAAEYEAWRARSRNAIERAGELTEREAKQVAEAYTRWRTADAALAEARTAWHRAKAALEAVPALDVIVTRAGEPKTIERRERASLAATERAAREAFESAEAEASRAQVSYTAVNSRVHAAAAERQRRAQADLNRSTLRARWAALGVPIDEAALAEAYGTPRPNQESRSLAALAARRVAGR